ncbi:hypothetical protein Sgly_1637 [Syntrophobotulus glycolicus DSM 8271]|uniref:Uncharacterized protein n=1 Tax=Syntrophobotulus glycolicus (strain DSM 8271 / FlGlyR) TaxID=645991 RepID=F0SYA0_SYNGF|nr:hypothetical protein [Syntrophobotulus glycolicus]ADY55935.1 hypothetical protein Sgly_1637 [Syntrophobotulus glycolicus DSM 8271]
MKKKMLTVMGTLLLLIALIVTGCSRGAADDAAADDAAAGKQENAGNHDRQPGDGQNSMQALMPDIAKALNMEQTELETQLQSGKKLADIAGEKNVAVDSLIAQIKSLLDADIDQAVQEEKITSDQASKQKEQTTQRATDMVNGKTPEPGSGGGPKDGERPDGQQGNPPDAPDASTK